MRTISQSGSVILPWLEVGSLVGCLVILVAAGAGPAVTATTHAYMGPANVTWVVYQDCDRPWQVVSGSRGRYQLPIRSGRYSIALVCAGENEVRIIHATTRELPSLQIWMKGDPFWQGDPFSYLQCSPSVVPRVLHAVSGRVAGLRKGDWLGMPLRPRTQIWNDFELWQHIGDDSAQARPGYSYDVPSGIHDLALLAATKYDVLGGKTTARGPDRVILMRDIRVGRDRRIDVDFARDRRIDVDFARDGIALVNRTVAVRGLTKGEDALAQVFFVTHRGTKVLLGEFLEQLSFAYRGIPGQHLRRGDFHRIRVDSDRGCVTVDVGTPRDLTVELPPPFGAAHVSLAARVPYARFHATWSPCAGAQAYRLTFVHSELIEGETLKRWIVLL